MKIEKLSDNQIRCTLGREDLSSLKMSISDFAYSSPKTRSLFQKVMKQAQIEHSFSPDNYPLMIEATPLSADSIQIVVTKIEDPDELDARFSRFSPDFDSFEEIDFEENYEEEVIEHTSSETVSTSAPKAVAYVFSTLDDVLALSKRLSFTTTLSTALYKSAGNEYCLLVEDWEAEANYSYVFSTIKEYSQREFATASLKKYMEEHCTPVIKQNALELLSML